MTNTTQTLPEGTHDLYEILGVKDHGHEHAAESDVEAAPVEHDIPSAPKPLVEYEDESRTVTLNISKVFKNVLPYILIFIVCVAIFFLFFTNFSLKSLFASVPTSTKQSASTKQTVPANQQAAYKAWISSYFYEVSDASVLDPNTDISGNGLTNYQKFLLGLNPKKQDTLGLGMSDTEALISGIDPLSGVAMTDSQKQFVADNIDLESISNRLSLAAANFAPKVAGANSSNNNDSGNAVAARDEQVLTDTKVQGSIDIPKLHISAPLIWTQDPKNFEKDLPNGLVHYPGTALPGEIGTSYISGHSSNYVWIKGKYNNVFAKLGDLKVGDSFTVTVKDTTGKTIILHYVVSDSKIFKSDDQAQFADLGKSIVALSTCWPVGTSANRLVVFGQLTQVER